MDSKLEWEAHFYRDSLISQAALGSMIERGSSLSRVFAHTKDRNMAALTAHRSVSLGSTQQERQSQAARNKANNAKLKSAIRAANYGFIVMKGRYIENEGTDEERPVVEESFLIVSAGTHEEADILLKFTTKLGEVFKQDSIMFKRFDDTDAYLYFQDGKRIKLGRWQPNKVGPYFSELIQHKATFAFGETQELKRRPKKCSEMIPPTLWWELSLEGRKQYMILHPEEDYRDFLNVRLPKR